MKVLILLAILCFIGVVHSWKSFNSYVFTKQRFASKLFESKILDFAILPSQCKEFVAKLRSFPDQCNLKDSISLIDKYFSYVEVPFANGDMINAANQNIGSAKIFSFALLLNLNQDETLRLFGEVYRNLSPSGNDHQNIRNFQKSGWGGIKFEQGIAIKENFQ